MPLTGKVALRHPPHRAGSADAIEELLKHAEIQLRPAIHFGMELHAEGEAIVHRALDGFDHVVRASGSYGEPACDHLHCHVVQTADPTRGVEHSAVRAIEPATVVMIPASVTLHIAWSFVTLVVH